MTKCKEQALDSMNRKVKTIKSTKTVKSNNERRSGKVEPTGDNMVKNINLKPKSKENNNESSGSYKLFSSVSTSVSKKTKSSNKTGIWKQSHQSSIDLNRIVTAPVKQDIVMAALRRDAQEYYSTGSEDYRTYVNDNKVPYFVLANTWYIQLMDYAGKPLPDFHVLLASRGLLPLIKEAKDVSNAIIQDVALPQSFFSSLLHYNLAYGKSVQEALQVLRYPKRFSPFHTDALEEQCFADFLARNNRAKMINRKELPYWLITYLREIINVVLKDYKITAGYDEYETFSSFPTGTTAEGHTTFVQKFLEMEYDRPFYFGAIGAYRTPGYCQTISKTRFCKAVSVPKTAEARRIIAEEQSNRQVDMYSCFCELDKCIASSKGKYGTAGRITLHDQSRNQRLALKGSLDGSYATIDSTAASDSVTVDRVRSVFPKCIVAQWDSLRSEYVDVGGKRYTLHLYSTMGSRLTFPVETLLFWAIAVAATETVCRYTHKRFRPDDISVYGDDLIVPTFAFETVVEFLELCGFEVNREKSYSTGLYRESCGEEYYAGYNVSSHYYPRRQLPVDEEHFDVATAVVQLCELQHKLYSFSECNTFLSEMVKLLYPQITYSSVGERYSDLWSDYMPKSIAKRPYGMITCTKGIRRNIYKITNVQVPVPEKRYYVTDRSGKQTVRYYSDVPVVGDSIICCDTSATNEYHTTILTKYAGNADYLKDTDRLAYIRFLKEGPMYADPLLRLLGISDKPVRESLCDRGHAKLIKLMY